MIPQVISPPRPLQPPAHGATAVFPVANGTVTSSYSLTDRTEALSSSELAANVTLGRYAFGATPKHPFLRAILQVMARDQSTNDAAVSEADAEVAHEEAEGALALVDHRRGDVPRRAQRAPELPWRGAECRW